MAVDDRGGYRRVIIDERVIRVDEPSYAENSARTGDAGDAGAPPPVDLSDLFHLFDQGDDEGVI